MVCVPFVATEGELSDCLRGCRVVRSKVFAIRPLEEKLAVSGFNILASIMKDVRRPSTVRLLGQAGDMSTPSYLPCSVGQLRL